MCVKEREGVCERERESVDGEELVEDGREPLRNLRESVCLFVRKSVCERERVFVFVRKRVCVRESVFVCV